MSDLALDCSNNNGPIDIAAAKKWGVKAVIAKASEGTGFVDPYFSGFREQCRKLKLPFGAYHFFRPGDSPTIQAALFCKLIGKLERTDLRPTIDYETSSSQSAAQKVADIKAFNAVVRKTLGCWPIFYSFSGFLPELELKETLGDGLWLANYGPDDGHEHAYPIPAPWRKVNLHQFTQHGKIPGHAGDVDLSYGKLSALLAHPWLAKL